MRSYVKSFISFVMWIFSEIYPYSLSLRIHVIRDLLYTLWIRNFIGNLGDRSRIAYPCSLQGEGQRQISIGNDTTIQSHFILGCWAKYGNQKFTPSIVIGNHCHIGDYCHITACNKIIIGDGLLTGRYVYIGDNSHGSFCDEELKIPPVDRKLQSKGEVVIGDNVWIGDKVTILAGVHIGDTVVIASNAVVTRDILNNTIVAGVPAKIIKKI